MDYNNGCAASAKEVAPRSPHHAAMLLLEQRVNQLSKSIELLSATLEPALRPHEPQPSGTEGRPENSPSNVPVIAHVDAVISAVDSCIRRTESLAGRLAI